MLNLMSEHWEDVTWSRRLPDHYLSDSYCFVVRV